MYGIFWVANFIIFLFCFFFLFLIYQTYQSDIDSCSEFLRNNSDWYGIVVIASLHSRRGRIVVGGCLVYFDKRRMCNRLSARGCIGNVYADGADGHYSLDSGRRFGSHDIDQFLCDVLHGKSLLVV